MNITKSSFGITNDGEEAFLYRLENTSGAYVTITSFGCRVVNICVRTKLALCVMYALAMTPLLNMKKIRQVSVPLSADMQTVLKKVRSH